MGNRVFNFIAKFTYCGYLVHAIVIQVIGLSSKSSHYTTLPTVLYYWVADFTFVMFFAGVLMLLVEIPFANLDELLLSKARGG